MHLTARRFGLLGALVAFVVALALSPVAAQATPAPGPLVVSKKNPRYFAVKGDHGKPVYLTGSHLWNNLQDGVGVPGSCDSPTPMSFPAYLDFLEQHGHNFIRLWRWEQTKFKLPPELDTGGPYCIDSPQPWERTGPGTAFDGGAKFDLAQLDQDYFDRLRERVLSAGDEGIYASVMLFEGFCLHLCEAPYDIGTHPFDGPNNVSGIDIDTIADYQSSTISPAVKSLQKAYIRKVVDTVQDLDNVLYEVTNESYTGSTEWQYWVVRYLKRYERQQAYERHPVGQTAQYPGGVDAELFASPADWISPGLTYDYANDPPAATGDKVIVADDDHFSPCASTAVWAWKSLTRGLNPIILDCGIFDPANPLPDFDYLEPTRYAMGDSRALTGDVPLASMPPRGDLTSTAYALAKPGRHYVVFQPEATATPFTVTLEPGKYSVRWFDVDARVWTKAPAITVGTSGPQSFTPPFATPSAAVLKLRHQG